VTQCIWAIEWQLRIRQSKVSSLNSELLLQSQGSPLSNRAQGNCEMRIMEDTSIAALLPSRPSLVSLGAHRVRTTLCIPSLNARPLQNRWPQSQCKCGIVCVASVNCGFLGKRRARVRVIYISLVNLQCMDKGEATVCGRGRRRVRASDTNLTSHNGPIMTHRSAVIMDTGLGVYHYANYSYPLLMKAIVACEAAPTTPLDTLHISAARSSGKCDQLEASIITN